MKRATALLSLAALAAVAAPAQDIEITPAESRATSRAPARAYTGEATFETLFAQGERSSMMAVNVSFEPGARTVWHNHLAGQYLIVTSGVGWVQQRGGPKREVREGDVVWTPPGVFHWHGATTESAMSHLAVWQFVDGSGGEVGEHVSDEVYLAAGIED
jgi:quercetin dioxygenase-like cupin family protein